MDNWNDERFAQASLELKSFLDGDGKVSFATLSRDARLLSMLYFIEPYNSKFLKFTK